MARTAVVAEVGPGLGESLARKFAAEGCDVGLFARSGDYIADLAADLPTDAVAAPTDLADPEQIRAGFERVREDLGPVDVLVNHASAGAWKGIRNCSVQSFERDWAVTGRGASVGGRPAVATDWTGRR
jgi:NAD(P)-dependent dehydrogenase (short-subunit alcohol dehydrogenase family)